MLITPIPPFRLIVVVSLAFNCHSAFAAEFHLAISGKDTNPGTEAQPFATFEKARDALRKWRQAGTTAGGATVHVHGGLYEISQPLVLTAEDSGTPDAPVVWRSFGRETVVLSGGRMIRDFKPVTNAAVLDRLPMAAHGKVLQSDLTAAGWKDFGEVATIGKRVELFLEGKGNWLNIEKAAEPGVLLENNLVDQDPGFVDAAKLNFQLKLESPAWALGFRRIPVEKIGLYDDALRAALPTILLSP